MADGNLPTYVTESTSIVFLGGYATAKPAGQCVNFLGGNTNSVGFLGVTNTEVPAFAANVRVGVDIEGIVSAFSAGAINIGDPVVSDGLGGFAAHFTINGSPILGRAMSATTGPNQNFLMKITREGKL